MVIKLMVSIVVFVVILDIIIGAPLVLKRYKELAEHGSAFVVYGRETHILRDFVDLSSMNLLNTDDGYAINGPLAGAHCGYSVAAGDVDSDGIGDVIVGCYDTDLPIPNAATYTGAGTVHIVYGEGGRLRSDVHLAEAGTSTVLTGS